MPGESGKRVDSTPLTIGIKNLVGIDRDGSPVLGEDGWRTLPLATRGRQGLCRRRIILPLWIQTINWKEEYGRNSKEMSKRYNISSSGAEVYNFVMRRNG
jgi:hypothetical protein